MSEIEVSSQIVNESGLPDSVISDSAEIRQIATALSGWVQAQRQVSDSMFRRGSYSAADGPLKEMRAARQAFEDDDVVSGIGEMIEGFMFQGVKWECSDPDLADVFNQVSRDIDMDSLVRKIGRDEFIYSQSVIVARWEKRTYRPRNKSQRERRKTFELMVPVEIVTVDPGRVLPINPSPFGVDKLAWEATGPELDEFKDPTSSIHRFVTGKYTPPADQLAAITSLGMDPENLLLLDPKNAWRWTPARQDFQQFPDLRMKSLFRLLDMKRNLLAADRAALVGATNYILLVKKGSKEQPATPGEMENLTENFNFIAKLPVIISDHRLEIEIITPKTDAVLNDDRYNVIDSRIMQRLLGTYTVSSGSRVSTNSNTFFQSVVMGLENRRRMLARMFEEKIARQIVERNNLKDEPSLVFTPRSIALAWDQDLIGTLVQLRTMREISRDTLLEHIRLDQATEAQRLEYEEKVYDDIFKTVVPFSSPDAQPGDPKDEKPEKTMPVRKGKPGMDEEN